MDNISNIKDLYFRLYVQKDCKLDCLLRDLSVITTGKIEKFNYVSNEIFYLDVNRNEFYNPHKIHEEDGFLYYKYCITNDPEQLITDDYKYRYFLLLCDLISKLKELGYDVICACDYEDVISRFLDKSPGSH